MFAGTSPYLNSKSQEDSSNHDFSQGARFGVPSSTGCGESINMNAYRSSTSSGCNASYQENTNTFCLDYPLPPRNWHKCDLGAKVQKQNFSFGCPYRYEGPGSGPCGSRSRSSTGNQSQGPSGVVVYQTGLRYAYLNGHQLCGGIRVIIDSQCDTAYLQIFSPDNEVYVSHYLSTVSLLKSTSAAGVAWSALAWCPVDNKKSNKKTNKDKSEEQTESTSAEDIKYNRCYTRNPQQREGCTLTDLAARVGKVEIANVVFCHPCHAQRFMVVLETVQACLHKSEAYPFPFTVGCPHEDDPFESFSGCFPSTCPAQNNNMGGTGASGSGAHLQNSTPGTPCGQLPTVSVQCPKTGSCPGVDSANDPYSYENQADKLLFCGLACLIKLDRCANWVDMHRGNIKVIRSGSKQNYSLVLEDFSGSVATHHFIKPGMTFDPSEKSQYGFLYSTMDACHAFGMQQSNDYLISFQTCPQAQEFKRVVEEAKAILLSREETPCTTTWAGCKNNSALPEGTFVHQPLKCNDRSNNNITSTTSNSNDITSTTTNNNNNTSTTSNNNNNTSTTTNDNTSTTNNNKNNFTSSCNNTSTTISNKTNTSISTSNNNNTTNNNNSTSTTTTTNKSNINNNNSYPSPECTSIVNEVPHYLNENNYSDLSQNSECCSVNCRSSIVDKNPLYVVSSKLAKGCQCGNLKNSETVPIQGSSCIDCEETVVGHFSELLVKCPDVEKSCQFSCIQDATVSTSDVWPVLGINDRPLIIPRFCSSVIAYEETLSSIFLMDYNVCSDHINNDDNNNNNNNDININNYHYLNINNINIIQTDKSSNDTTDIYFSSPTSSNITNFMELHNWLPFSNRIDRDSCNETTKEPTKQLKGKCRFLHPNTQFKLYEPDGHRWPHLKRMTKYPNPLVCHES